MGLSRARPDDMSEPHVPRLPTLAECRLVRGMILADDWDTAAQTLVDLLTVNRPGLGGGTGQKMFNQLIPNMLDRWEGYEEVAAILWGSESFTTEPQTVQFIWKAMGTRSKQIIVGAGSMGKSYTVGAWMLLDWLRDPQFTDIKVVSITSGHGKNNIFGHLKQLHSMSCVPLPGVVTQTRIYVEGWDKAGVELVAIQAGESGSGRLQGMHPSPRFGPPHRVFGGLTRKRILIDEAEEVPLGIWKDLDNFFTSRADALYDPHLICVAAANPRDKSSLFGQRCEPAAGWESIQVEESFRWDSKLGWSVLRLDAAQSENVISGTVVYKSLQTRFGFDDYLVRGETDPEYLTMARGWFPDASNVSSLVLPGYIYDRSLRMTYEFTGATVTAAGVDLAFDGGDNAVMAVGRWGPVSGWTEIASGVFTPARGDSWGLQVETFITLTKGSDTLQLVEQIKGLCESFDIAPEWLAVDMTGSGQGVFDVLRRQFGAVWGTKWGNASTTRRIMRDDRLTAEDTCDGLVTELVEGVAKYMEFNILKLSPVAEAQAPRLRTDLTQRRKRTTSRSKNGHSRVRVESKKEFKLRGNPSPDYGDALAELVEVIRRNNVWSPGMMPKPRRSVPISSYVRKMGESAGVKAVSGKRDTLPRLPSLDFGK